MKDDTVTMKEAAFMLDTDMAQDMDAYIEENTIHAIKRINSTPKLYEAVKGYKAFPKMIRTVCIEWAHDHGDELGDLFIAELESSVDWDKVAARV